jgi:hypothetical protein
MPAFAQKLRRGEYAEALVLALLSPILAAAKGQIGRTGRMEAEMPCICDIWQDVFAGICPPTKREVLGQLPSPVFA